MSQEQLLISNGNGSGAIAPNVNKLQQMVERSLDTLEAILTDETVPARDRAAIAFKILELAQGTAAPEKNIEADKDSTQVARSPQQPVTFTYPATFSPVPEPAADPNTLPINFIQIDNFLSAEDLEIALKLTAEKRHFFTDSAVHNKAQDQIKKYRQSSVLHHKYYAEFAEVFQQKVLATLPTALASLKRPSFQVSDIVIQLTAHNDGCYYSLHSDANTEMTKTREMTYVYYFYQEPKAFSGGELRMYETGVDGNSLFKRGKFEVIEPRNNSIIFFPSRLLHEVMPVSCPSKQFEHSRFTFNGWIRR